jgi:hypothetical protein
MFISHVITTSQMNTTPSLQTVALCWHVKRKGEVLKVKVALGMSTVANLKMKRTYTISNLVVSKLHAFANLITNKPCTIPKLITNKPPLPLRFLLFIEENAWVIE